MATFTGTVRYNDLEGGFHELVTDSGETYRLDGAGKLDDGAKVTVHGDLQSGGFGIHMTGGAAIKVSKVEPA
jgi:hypothetical protein